MTDTGRDPVEIARRLIRCKSVTPREGGALTYLQEVLQKAGFTCHRLPFSEAGTPDVDNLYARIGTAGPVLAFAGHTDVVPPGDEEQWSQPPFGAEIVDDIMYGRGAVDMKGAIACFVAATLDYLASKQPSSGSIALIITGDEEGPSINGTRKIVEWMGKHNQQADHCIVGEPSNPARLGDMIKVGRRGSMNGVLTVTGRQGHAAYPHLAANPIPALLDILGEYLKRPLDEGTAYFGPSNIEITSIDVGNEAVNVIPRTARAQFNIRYNDAHSAASLQELLKAQSAAILEGSGLSGHIEFQTSGESFITRPGTLVSLMSDVVRDVTGLTPERSTSGGTSDARFIKDICPVIEFGLVNRTIHQVDEQVPIEDLRQLTAIYRRFIENYFATVR